MAALPKSLPKICVALGFQTAAELSEAATREYKDGNRFLEFRLDHLTDPSTGIEVIRRFGETHPDVHVLATCRHKRHHGGFKGDFNSQLKLLQTAGAAGAAAIDIEIESAEQLPVKRLSELRETAPLIVSYHNFESTPVLAGVLRRLKRIPADAYKIASTAIKPTDNSRLLEFLRAEHDVPLVALAMAETGLPSRILGPGLGSLFTFAAPLDAQGTAAGQISLQTMRALYRAEKLTKQTRIYGVIADPVAHSKSPVIHNRGFQARRLDAVYLPFRVGLSQLGDWMKLATALPVSGFSVTIPHKERILRYLDVVDPLARRIGAVNTVYKKSGKWRGTNTDTVGVTESLRRHLRLGHSHILIAGYGGSARAAAFGLRETGAEITITGRDPKRAAALAKVVKGSQCSLEEAEARRFDVLVHATPVGMYPNGNGCLFQRTVPAGIVFDMVYNPRETQLLKRAKEQGAKVIHGSEMLLEQAARQFEIWTGETAPRAVMQKALDAALSPA